MRGPSVRLPIRRLSLPAYVGLSTLGQKIGYQVEGWTTPEKEESYLAVIAS